ncbi:MAG: hypothetical protein M0Z37_06105 [Nitrospiraceae bacterium]|nr:hypothetical protein [Nitrospiraceae bacterium]
MTMDDATNRHDSMFFVPEEGTASIFRGMADNREPLSPSSYFDLLFAQIFFVVLTKRPLSVSKS